jgi:hypothetical protein
MQKPASASGQAGVKSYIVKFTQENFKSWGYELAGINSAA